jgi:hypothetical protein
MSVEPGSLIAHNQRCRAKWRSPARHATSSRRSRPSRYLSTAKARRVRRSSHAEELHAAPMPPIAPTVAPIRAGITASLSQTILHDAAALASADWWSLRTLSPKDICSLPPRHPRPPTPSMAHADQTRGRAGPGHCYQILQQHPWRRADAVVAALHRLLEQAESDLCPPRPTELGDPWDPQHRTARGLVVGRTEHVRRR